MQLKQGKFGKAKIAAWYRPGTTDVNALIEVLDKRAYRRASVGFDVERGEHWLDLGANIGAFALYCKSKGATCVSYEPDPECYKVLTKNVPNYVDRINAAVSVHSEKTLTLHKPNDPRDQYRGTLLARRNAHAVEVKNVSAISLFERARYDGAKMDIEGTEHDLLDLWAMPRAEKLVFEYHLSRDNSLSNLRRRFLMLKRHYKNVVACPELMRLVRKGSGTGRTYYDRCIYCWGLKDAAK